MTMHVRGIAEMKLRADADTVALLAAVRRISARAEAQDHGTLAHNYYVDLERGVLIAHEHYTDAAGMVQHLSNMDPADVQVLLAAVESLSMRVFGPASAELRGMLAAFGGVEYFDFVSGFVR